MKQKDKTKTKEIAERRIRHLFELAKEEAEKRPAYARRYIELARQLARKTQTKIHENLRKSFCKECNLLFTAANKVRTKNGFLVYTCSCGAKRKFKI